VLGALDFAGGTVVHISSGVSALVAAILIGRRLKTSEPHDVTMTVLGASLLWFGWFGFNAGSALAAGGGLATSAFIVTNTAAAMAGLTWLTVSWIHKGRPSVIGMAAGAVAGLVAITPASGFVDVSGSIIIGLGAGTICYAAMQLRPRLKVDDALDVWAVHGIGGTWGALATGLFATVAINSAGQDGLFYGNPNQLLTQAIAVAATWIYAAVVTAIIVKLIDVTVGFRVKEHEESLGLDASQHGEIAYVLD
jgi:Amt family ammonium transporter